MPHAVPAAQVFAVEECRKSTGWLIEFATAQGIHTCQAQGAYDEEKGLDFHFQVQSHCLFGQHVGSRHSPSSALNCQFKVQSI